MTEAETEPPIFEYAVLSGTRDHVGTRLTAAGREGWLLNGMSTCVLPPVDAGGRDPLIIMTCVIMRQAPAEADQSGEGGS